MITILKSSASKLVVELFGTFIFTMLFISTQQLTLALGLWCITIFCWKVIGSHLNPAVTLAFMMRRDRARVAPLLGVSYMTVQIAGALMASLLMTFLAAGIDVMHPTNKMELWPAVV